ncbi:MAG TPA: RDD family protein [Candidatus Paceibacterota bacterium]|nr:RDD family protein [Candidatus Paceibacterota bacterium]
MFCSKCGAQIPEGAQFCSACGTPVLEPKHTAGILLRLSNAIVDAFGLAAFNIAAIIATILLAALSPGFGLIISVPLLILSYTGILYYVLFESIWQRTLGKWITNTKVVKLDGTKPGFWRIVGRSLLRLVPFEAFSFVFGEHPFGWHDRLSGTMVVPVSYSVEDAKSINPKDKGKTHVVGVVIALIMGIFVFLTIIGILAGIVLAALDNARTKSQDAHLTELLDTARVNMELYQATGNTYVGGCTDPTVASALQDITALTSPKNPTCNATTTQWAISAPLHLGGAECVDSSGDPISRIAKPLTSETSCSDSASQ